MTAARVTPTVTGCVDVVTANRVFGWAWDPRRPDNRIAVHLVAGDEGVGAVIANLPREDLAANGVGDGAHAFEATFPAPLAPESLRVLAICPYSGEPVELSPRSAAPPTVPTPPPVLEEVKQMLTGLVEQVATLEVVVVRFDETLRQQSLRLDGLRREPADKVVRLLAGAAALFAAAAFLAVCL